MQSLLILGRQPKIGLAELISLYGEDKVTALSNIAAIVDVDPCNFRFDRLGGSLRFCKLLSTLDTNSWAEVERHLLEVSPEHSRKMPEGKMTLGISLYGFNVDYRDIIGFGSKLKKAIQTTGRSVRFVPNKEPALNTAQVLHNKLTGDRSWEIIAVRVNDKVYLAQTVKVQDITAYARRDQARPHRDSRVGMLPPKLAQIIINLATGPLDPDVLSSICEEDDKNAAPNLIDQSILDPFCGTGVILQEASLMGYKIMGSDIDPRMIDYTTKNLEWLKPRFRLNDIDLTNITVGDATNTKWSGPDFIATEVNLGKPLSSIPDSRELATIIDQANTIVEKFLANLAGQVKSGARVCLAIPAWQISHDTFKRLPLIDRISDLGYNLVDFKHISAEELTYYRADQIVARQLLVMTRK
jgi:tRNA G10  N-methylase Trm11